MVSLRLFSEPKHPVRWVFEMRVFMTDFELRHGHEGWVLMMDWVIFDAAHI